MRFTSQAEMIQYAREVLARLQPALPRLFLRVPKMTVDVRPIPADREASTASNYTAGTADGTRPAWFNMNTYRPTEQVKYTHRGAGASRNGARSSPADRHRARTAGAARVQEGVHGRSVLRGLGTVRGVTRFGAGRLRDPTTKFGQLASEQFRAVRLVVDTGLHAMGWSRDRAREYFALHVPGQSLAEVDRYIARPGQALAYKLGELKIKELRRSAEQALGPRFDIRQFHDVVLRNGTLPLDMLEEQVNAFIATSR